ncbi:MAG TPA: serine protease [Verrucomicrobiae bacterium]|jgi:serine protease Do
MNAASSYKPIIATICEVASREPRALPILPNGSEALDLFPFHDPFGLRRAVVPVLMKDADDVMEGMGTAFHIDGWGTFLTADHVIEPVRRHSQRTPSDGDEKRFTFGPSDVYPVLLLGFGLVYGQVRVPKEALSFVASICTPIRERDDPLASLSGRPELEAASDIAVMHLATPVPDRMVGTLAVRFSGWQPRKGDTVLALGYPELECQPLDDAEMNYLLSDGMSAAYGHIIDVHPNGRGSDPTPVIEVEANWPCGMSGGPVFNDLGEVIGIVSRSLVPSKDAAGNGCAACLELMPWLRKRVPTLDMSNPGWRVGWAVMRKDPRKLAGFYKEEEDALRHQRVLSGDSFLAFGSNRIGSPEEIVFSHATGNA